MTLPVRPKAQLLAVVLAGTVVFAAGLLLASKRLPEWRAGAIPPPSFFKNRFREIVAAAGIRAVSSDPRVHVRSRVGYDEEKDLSPMYEALGPEAADWLTAAGCGFYIEVAQTTGSPDGPRALFKTSLSQKGEAWFAGWGIEGFSSALETRAKWPDFQELRGTLIRVLLRPGESVGVPEDINPIGGTLALYPIRDVSPSQFLAIGYAWGSREIGAIRVRRQIERFGSLSFWLKAAIQLLVALGGLALFLTLTVQRRIGIKNGALLSFLLFLVLLAGSLSLLPDVFEFINAIFRAIFAALALFFLWSGAESWIRSWVSGFTTSLDALRAGRLGPRGGSALLSGCGMGAGLAGARLGIMALAASVPGLAPDRSSVSVPFFAPEGISSGTGCSRLASSFSRSRSHLCCFRRGGFPLRQRFWEA